jgi:hypothetical protein
VPRLCPRDEEPLQTTHRDRTRATCKGPDHLVYILTLFWSECR